jgi:hypothetical protein
VAKMDEDELSSVPFDERANRRPVPHTDDIVALPMPDLGTIGNRLWRHFRVAPFWDGDPYAVSAVQQRRQLGLRADRGWVQQLEAKVSAGSSGVNSSYGPLLDQQEQRLIGNRTQAMHAAEQIAARYLQRLPPDQAGELRAGDDIRSLVVQVPRDSARVQKSLQAAVGPAITVQVETVRYPAAELRRLAQRIQQIPQLHWSTIATGGGNDRVDVSVPRHVGQAQQLIHKIANPCEYTVSQGAATTAVGEANGPATTQSGTGQ